MRAVAIVSGGLDSVTLVYWLRNRGYDVQLLGFDYGQRHRKELQYAYECAERLEASFHLIDLRSMGVLLEGSALTDPSIPVPDGHYADASMRVTVVPNRNAIMLSIAWGVAVVQNASVIAAGFHSGDHPIYPDCRPEFVKAFFRMARLATQGMGRGELELLTPFIELDKSEIVTIGTALRVPLSATWSCYKGADTHCGTCGTCVERREAFAQAEVDDPTVYAPI